MTGTPFPLRIAACRACGWRSHMARAFCPSCGGRALSDDAVEGRGTVFSVTVIHRAAGDGPLGPPPFALVLVTLDGGLADRVMAVAGTAPPIGARVRVGPLRDGPGGPYLAMPEEG